MLANDMLSAPNGGQVNFVVDGEVICEIPLKVGLTRAGDIMAMCPPEAQIEVTEGVWVVPRRVNVGIQKAEGYQESGANPDFRPTLVSEFEREMRVTLGQLAAENRALAAKGEARAAVPEMPKPEPEGEPKEEEQTVVE